MNDQYISTANNLRLKPSGTVLKIICDLVDYKNDLDDVKKGQYLQITLSGNTYLIDFNEYKAKYDLFLESKKGFSDNRLTGVGNSGNISPNLNSLLRYILLKIDRVDQIFKNIEEVFILSTVHSILELPWETLNDNGLVVIRKFNNGNDISQPNLLLGNLAILMSHAYIGLAKDVKDSIDSEISSIYEILNFYYKESSSSHFRTERILLSKHTTKQSLNLIDWTNYNLIHIASHVDDMGSILLEEDNFERYKYPDLMTKSDLIKLMAKCNKKFDLVFFATCNSTNDISDEGSIAFKMIENDISKYCIGYSYGVKTKIPQEFTERFYNYLTIEKNIKNAYKKSISDLYKDSTITINSIPYLYQS